MTVLFSSGGRDDANDALVDRLDLGAVNSSARLWVQNAAGTTLAVIELADPAFASSSGGVVAASGLPKTGTVSVSGTAARFRAVSKDEDVEIQGSIGVAGSGADAIIDDTSLVSGGFVRLTSWSMTAPGAGL
jgi:hypothetical protein